MTIGKPERVTQNRVVALFQDELGYDYLGNWAYRDGNANIEEGLLSDWLQEERGHSPEQIARALQTLRSEADNPNRLLVENNQAVYSLLRYGVPVKVAAGEVTETVKLIDWERPERNRFALAEEVTLHGGHEKRPDIVLYVNGLALAVLELKNSRVPVDEAVRQSIVNQRDDFIGPFFSTVQFIFAGNDSEGLRYGTIGTPAKYFLRWKEDEAVDEGIILDKYLRKLCDQRRLLEIIYDFVLFDAGTKKLPRVHQYFGIKAAQESIQRREGGIIWHTQGSGKSIVMVLLAKWILENVSGARVAVITDRDELDKQIEGVFRDAGEKTVVRTRSGRELMRLLGQASPRLICSLVHKFGVRGVKDFDAFIAELEAESSAVVGELFVFVDECHRTQGGRLHRTMKALLPNAVFIGFTGTPLLKKDRKTTLEVFGRYIHTYKYPEAVADGVVLDLVYEARDIDQRLGSEERVDAWFEARTRGLNEWQKAALREQWGTLQKVLSSRSRMERVVQDVFFDFSVKPRISEDRGTAMLVAASIYEACRYYDLFQKTPFFRDRCALITSYSPQTRNISTEDSDSHSESEKRFVYDLYEALLKGVEPKPGLSREEVYEAQAKRRFIEQPANMKLLIVVSKLLTGFDAPSCTYLYIDKSMRDHDLFQAICRTNRLDGDDKPYGQIVDYMDLFRKVGEAIAVYSSELNHIEGDAVDPEVLLADRIAKGTERLEAAREALAALCEPVAPPGEELDYLRFFCGNTEIADDVAERAPLRVALYKLVASLVRAYASIADELAAAGYGPGEGGRLKGEIDHYLKMRQAIRLAAEETIDLKSYEADMRHLIDTYIEADDPRKISPFDDMTLLELMAARGVVAAVDALPDGIKASQGAVQEVIENNVRSKIIQDHLSNPAFYDRMSKLLDEIIAARKAKALEYEEYLKRIAELAAQVQAGHGGDAPARLDTPGRQAIYDNLREWFDQRRVADEPAAYNDQAVDPVLELAMRIDEAMRDEAPGGWRGVLALERVVKGLIYKVVEDPALVERLFPVIYQHGEY